MKYTIKVGGYDVVASDPEAVMALVREMEKKPTKKPKPTNKSSIGDLFGVDTVIAEKAIRFLETMARASGYVATSEIMAVLGVSSPNAVGGTTKKINSLLDDLGFNKDSVYKNPKKPKQPRVWGAGKDIEFAIETIQKLIDEDQK